MTNQDTATLIQAAQAGSDTAVNALYRRYFDRVRAIIRIRMGTALRSKEQSDDILQEAMLKSLSGLGRFEYRTEGAFLAYLAKKVREVFADRADHWATQRRGANGEISLDALNSSGATFALSLLEMSSDASPEKVVIRSEDIDRLFSALDVLRDGYPEYWELIVAAKLEGQTYAELAADSRPFASDGQRVGSHQHQIDALKQKMRRALAKLTKIFRDLASTSTSQ